MLPGRGRGLLMLTSKLTGAVRQRPVSRLFRKPLLVLQVEVHVKGYEVEDSRGNGRDLDYTYWRDGEVEDLATLCALQAGLL